MTDKKSTGKSLPAIANDSRNPPPSKLISRPAPPPPPPPKKESK